MQNYSTSYLYHFRFLTSTGLKQEKYGALEKGGNSYSKVNKKVKKKADNTTFEDSATFDTRISTENPTETTTELIFENQTFEIVPDIGAGAIATLAGGGLG